MREREELTTSGEYILEVARAGEGELSQMAQRVAKERARLKTLQEIGVLLGSTLDLNELLQKVLTRVSDVMEADRSTLYLLDEDTNELWSKVAQGEHVIEIRLNVGEGLAGSVAESGRALNLKDAYLDVRFNAEWDRKTGFRTRSVLCVPMKNQHGRIIGVLQVLNKRGGYFTPDDEALLEALAAQAAVSVENSKLFLSVVGKNIELLETQDQLERKIRELDVLFEIAQVSASAAKLDDLLQGVLARAMRAIDAEAASLLLSMDDSGDLWFRAAFGGGAERVHGKKMEAGRGVCGFVAKTQRPHVIHEIDEGVEHARVVGEDNNYHPYNLLCVPLRWEEAGEIRTGAVELLNKEQGQGDFSDDDLKLATVIAGHISTAIEQARNRHRRAREERLSALGQFLSGVLHDLKAPMTVIKGYTRLLSEESDPDTREEFVATILRQVDTLEAMTKETLAFARGETELWVRKVYVYQFFEELAEQIRRAVGDRIHVEVELLDRGIGYLDAHKIQRAVHNLARNAAEALADEGRMGTFKIVVDRTDDGELLLQFIDDGPGVPDAIFARLFDSFTTHGKAGGTGLGLAVVKQVVEAHGGKILCRSKPGETVFEMTLPQPAETTSAGTIAAR